ncbi:hypothetical protein LINGRAHAP2_LOCUS1634 [Linum grandiflorum]
MADRYGYPPFSNAAINQSSVIFWLSNTSIQQHCFGFCYPTMSCLLSVQ